MDSCTYEDTPGRTAIAVMESIRKDVVFKKPSDCLSVKRTKKKKVLEEDTYVEEIGKIIQRDFFPDLEKIRAQTQYLEAMEKNDTIKLRELYMKYSGKRPIIERIPSPATFETPANIHNNVCNPNENKSNENMGIDKEVVDVDNVNREKHIRLDQFLNSHTSEDNERFSDILVEAELKRRQKYLGLYEAEEQSIEKQNNLLALPSISQQAALPEKQLNVDTWGYKNQNYIMYNPDGVQPTPEEELEICSKKQGIVFENTRLKVNPFNEVQSKEAINELAKSQAKVLDGKIGVDGKELLKADTPKVGGFSFVRTPSPSPSVLGSPLMTWGEIEGTPFRLDGSDTPLPKFQGAGFKMAEPPRREQIAIALAEKVGEKNRDQKQKAIEAQRRQFASPSPRPHSSSIDRLATMSPAARKLATSHLRLGVNSDLRSIYSPNPHCISKATPTSILTPKLVVTPNIGVKRHDSSSKEISTDDLLKISLPKRQKAADFF